MVLPLPSSPCSSPDPILGNLHPAGKLGARVRGPGAATESGPNSRSFAPSAVPCPCCWPAWAFLPWAEFFSALPSFFLLPLFLPTRPVTALKQPRQRDPACPRPGFSSLTWTLHHTASLLFLGLGDPSGSLCVSPNFFCLCSCLSLVLPYPLLSFSLPLLFFPGSVHLPPSPCPHLSFSLHSLFFLHLSLFLLSLPFPSPSPNHHPRPPPPQSRSSSGRVPWVRGAPGSPWSSLTAARPRWGLGGGMGPEIPCGEACPTPHPSLPPVELGTRGKKRVSPHSGGQGSFHGSHLESFSDPL